MGDLFNTLLYKNIFFSKFETTPFTPIWLEISINWYTKSQGPKKKCTHGTHFKKERIHSCPLTLLAIRVVLLHTLYGVLNPLIPQL